MVNNNLIIKRNGEVIKLKISREVKKIGTGCHVLLPAGMEGKIVYVEYEVEK